MYYKIAKGIELEKALSLKFHQKGLPLLVSSVILREIGAGQVDICFWRPGRIEIIEVKSSGNLGKKQHSRLLRSGEFLSWVFDASPRLHVISSLRDIAKLQFLH